jgi:hypothetical protein
MINDHEKRQNCMIIDHTILAFFKIHSYVHTVCVFTPEMANGFEANSRLLKMATEPIIFSNPR